MSDFGALGMLPMLLAARKMGKGGGRGGGGGFLQRVRGGGQQQVMHPQMMQPQMMPQQFHGVPIVGNNFGGDDFGWEDLEDEGEEFGAAVFAGEGPDSREDEEDEDEFGALEEEEAEADDDEFGGPGRLSRLLAKRENKAQDWGRKSRTRKTKWGRKRARKKESKWSRSADRTRRKLARKTGNQNQGAGDSGRSSGGDMEQGFRYERGGAPPGAGHLVLIDLYPSETPSGNHAGSTTQPLIRTVVPASGESSLVTLKSELITHADFKIVGVKSHLLDRADGGRLFVKDLKVKGIDTLFLGDNWVNASNFDIDRVENTAGLREYPEVKSPNQVQCSAVVIGDENDALTWGISLEVEILSDVMTKSSGPRTRREPGAYAR